MKKLYFSIFSIFFITHSFQLHSSSAFKRLIVNSYSSKAFKTVRNLNNQKPEPDFDFPIINFATLGYTIFMSYLLVKIEENTERTEKSIKILNANIESLIRKN